MTGRQAVRAAGLVLLAVVALLAGSVLAWQMAYAGRIFPGVRVLGTDLGGRTTAEAEAVLAAPAAAAADGRVTVSAGDTTRATTWRDLGVRLAPAALAAEALAVGRSGNPLERLGDQWTATTRGLPLGAAESIDEPTLNAYLAGLAQAVDRPPRDARLLVQPSGTVEYTPSQDGRALDLPAAASAVREARRAGASELQLPLRQTPPAIPDALRQEARAYAEQVLARPLVLAFEGRQWTIEPAELADWLDFEAAPGARMTASLTPAAVRRRLSAIAGEIDRPVVDARFDWNDGSPRLLRSAQAGRQLDLAAAQEAVLRGATAAERTIALPVQATAPSVGDDPAALGLRERIEEASTSFAGAVPEKAHNIRLAAERLHGTVVPAGGKFSFNQAIGPTTLDAGYQWGFGITSEEGSLRTVPSVAGGICQVATTVFQAFFWSGYRLEQRHWHLYWIPAYTSRGVVGLDATVDEDAGLDLEFINTTGQAVLIQAATDADSVTFRLYGTRPPWRVEVAPAAISNRTPPDPTPLVEEDATLPAGRRVAVETAREGFDVTVLRTVTEGGDVRSLPLKSTYRPSRNVTLVGTGGAATGASASVQNRPAGGGTRE